jgi:peptidyl-prolyl cis-trans isomerase SurA
MKYRLFRASAFFAAMLAAQVLPAGGAGAGPGRPASAAPGESFGPPPPLDTSVPGGTMAAAAAAAATPPPGGAPLADSDSVIAVVEDRIITVEDMRREIIPQLSGLRAHNQQEYDKMLGELENEVLNGLINRILIVKDFQKDPKRHIPPSYIDNAIAETLLKTPFDGDRSKFLLYLRDEGWTMRDYRKRVEEDIIYEVMRNQQHKNESVVSPVRIESYYQENQSKFYQEAAAHWRMITFNRADGETDAQLLARVQPVLDRLKAGEKFDALAREVSQDKQQAQGGDWGWRKKSELSPEFADPLFKLAPGEVSDPIVNPKGCYLLQLVERKEAGIQTLPEVSGEIEKILAAQMAREAEDRWIQRLRANAFISVVREFVTPADPVGSSQH